MFNPLEVRLRGFLSDEKHVVGRIPSLDVVCGVVLKSTKVEVEVPIVLETVRVGSELILEGSRPGRWNEGCRA